jgi:protein-S-isoprenylcysteine O-methyltransferase Ste14
MKDIPLVVFVGLLLSEIVGEYSAMLYTGALSRKHRKEWTYYAVAFPFKAMLGAAVVEFVYLRSQPPLASVLAGSLLAGSGIVIRVLGHLQLGRAFSPYVEKEENHQLVQSGMYAKIRHPMYVGTILLFLGMPLVLAANAAWLFTALGLAGTVIRIHKEEAFLIQELAGYQEYAEKTWRLVPYVY